MNAQEFTDVFSRGLKSYLQSLRVSHVSDLAVSAAAYADVVAHFLDSAEWVLKEAAGETHGQS